MDVKNAEVKWKQASRAIAGRTARCRCKFRHTSCTSAVQTQARVAMQTGSLRPVTPPLFHPNFGGVSVAPDYPCWGQREHGS